MQEEKGVLFKMSNTPFVQFAKDLHKKNENDILSLSI